VRDEIESTTGHEVAQGGVYVTLTRLEKKGLLRSHLSDPTPVRGGMAKIPRTRSTIIHTR
jgi:DNA-binding PadR family transcriptional regulator